MEGNGGRRCPGEQRRQRAEELAGEPAGEGKTWDKGRNRSRGGRACCCSEELRRHSPWATNQRWPDWGKKKVAAVMDRRRKELGFGGRGWPVLKGHPRACGLAPCAAPAGASAPRCACANGLQQAAAAPPVDQTTLVPVVPAGCVEAKAVESWCGSHGA